MLIQFKDLINPYIEGVYPLLKQPHELEGLELSGDFSLADTLGKIEHEQILANALKIVKSENSYNAIFSLSDISLPRERYFVDRLIARHLLVEVDGADKFYSVTLKTMILAGAMAKTDIQIPFHDLHIRS